MFFVGLKNNVYICECYLLTIIYLPVEIVSPYETIENITVLSNVSCDYSYRRMLSCFCP